MEHNHAQGFVLTTTAISFFFFILINFPQSYCDEESNYTICSRPLKCGYLPNIYYPFWDDDHNRPQFCGGGDKFKLNCSNGEFASIQMGSQSFLVHNISPPRDYTMTISFPDVLRNLPSCSPDLTNTTLDQTVFSYTKNVQNITFFFDCPSDASTVPSSFPCPNEEKGFYVNDEDLAKVPAQLITECKRRIQVPASNRIGAGSYADMNSLMEALKDGFEVNYRVGDASLCKQCLESNHGACGHNLTDHQFTCYPSPPPSHQWNWQRKTIVGASIIGLLICASATIFCSICKASTWRDKFWLIKKSNKDIEAFLKTPGALAVKRYKFSDVKKITNSFKVKLGQGGFGVVYKGELPSNISVAVKILNSSKGNGEELINEVASISRTSHVNVVTLLGYCSEGRKKVLIYEFMPNGSLDKFINKKGQETIASLSLESLYQIAIGIARGLEYLHRGCNTRILHFDIKPHNILLDENFCPKISDFGLAKLCPRNNSIVSMSDPRGTCGYLAPEMWNRRFGGVSHKSDVYSYGMILLDMVEGRKNTSVEASHSSETYFPDWIYKRLEQCNLRSDDGVTTIEENDIVRRMIIVGLWCIQTFPNDRPTMSRVIDMLEGSQISLEIPPKPILSSPARSIQESSTT